MPRVPSPLCRLEMRMDPAIKSRGDISRGGNAEGGGTAGVMSQPAP